MRAPSTSTHATAHVREGMPPHTPPPVSALSFGPEAALLLAGEGPGTEVVALRVLARLSTALYACDPQGHIVCVAGEQAEDGPLTVRVSRASMDALLAEASAEAEVIKIDLSSARRWTAEPTRTPAHVGARLEAARALADAVAQTPVALRPSGSASLHASPMAGCAPLARYLSDDLLVRAGVPLTDAWGHGLLHRVAVHLHRFAMALAASGAPVREASATAPLPDASVRAAAEALVGLLGLGPGLTPSGDDVVMGVLAALVWQAWPGACAPAGLLSKAWVEELARSVRQAAPRCTNRISARLLWHAAAGVLYAPAMRVGAALMAGDPDAVRREAPCLLAIGSTSGADLAVGLLAGALCVAGGSGPGSASRPLSL